MVLCRRGCFSATSRPRSLLYKICHPHLYLLHFSLSLNFSLYLSMFLVNTDIGLYIFFVHSFGCLNFYIHFINTFKLCLAFLINLVCLDVPDERTIGLRYFDFFCILARTDFLGHYVEIITNSVLFFYFNTYAII